MSKNIDKAINGRTKQLKIDVVYSKKGHYNAAAVWNVVHYTLGTATVVVASWIGVKNATLASETVVLLSLTAAALGALMTFLKPQEKASQHKLSGDDFDNLLQQISTFNDVEMLHGSDTDHTETLKALSEQKTTLNKDSLPIPKIAYLITRVGVKKGEASYTEKF